MTSAKKFKYDSEIKEIAALKITCPPNDLTSPDNLEAYRFIFETDADYRNHIPPGKRNPSRYLSTKDKGDKKCSLYGLSCFVEKKQAIDFHKSISNAIPNFKKIVGDTLSFGVLTNDDGLVSKPDENTHFDLFEFENCNLATKFSSIGSIS